MCAAPPLRASAPRTAPDRHTPTFPPKPLAFFYTVQNNEPMMFEHADDNPILVLDDDQSWKLIEGTKHGRLVVIVGGEPDIFPVNYAVSGRKLYLRTAPGNKLAELTINAKVLFETDGILADEAWSIVLRGTARVLDQSADIAAAEALGLKPWVPTLKDFYVEIEPTRVSGRHFQFGEHPERET
jgi:uncharacterized protein